MLLVICTVSEFALSCTVFSTSLFTVFVGVPSNSAVFEIAVPIFPVSVNVNSIVSELFAGTSRTIPFAFNLFTVSTSSVFIVPSGICSSVIVTLPFSYPVLLAVNLYVTVEPASIVLSVTSLPFCQIDFVTVIFGNT